MRQASLPSFVLPAAFFMGAFAVPTVAAAQPTDRIEAYRQFAIEHPGNANAGEQLFLSDKNLVCTNCHRITGVEKSGPNLDGIADKYSRRELIDQILRPSASIKPGYEQSIVLTTDGHTYTGRINRVQKSMIKLIDVENKLIDVQRPDIEEIRESTLSLMPDNLPFMVSPQQFSDLIAYLETLHLAVTTGFRGPDEPVEVPRIKQLVKFVPLHPEEMKFSNPVWCSGLPGAAGQLVVLEHQECKIWRLEPTTSGIVRHLFLDITGQVKYGANWGLMGIAFHPDFKTNRRYFLEHQVQTDDKIVKTAIVERQATADLLHDAGKPSRQLMGVEAPAYNHNGGCIAFGPDGMLYIGFGDGGFQNDPNGNGQNMHVALSKMLRIDVDHRDEGLEYAIPKDNPFLAARQLDPAILPEIWALGLREPWRYSFDMKTGNLWVGDVGQDKYEEVCLVRAGENHGWNVYEGYEYFSSEYHQAGSKFTPPLYAYPHSFGASVTGGHVYRGKKSPSFDGIYIFGDYETRRVWGLKEDAGRVVAVRELGEMPQHPVSFGEDDRGELYVVGYEGTIYRLDLSQSKFE
jgi:putative heme-binding domain-containing protein